MVLYIVQLHVYTLYVVRRKSNFFFILLGSWLRPPPFPNQKVNRMKKNNLNYVCTYIQEPHEDMRLKGSQAIEAYVPPWATGKA